MPFILYTPISYPEAVALLYELHIGKGTITIESIVEDAIKRRKFHVEGNLYRIRGITDSITLKQEAKKANETALQLTLF